ncbi:MAG TPA: uracil-DNA glycosylase [Alphaproteobacteria bacterium]
MQTALQDAKVDNDATSVKLDPEWMERIGSEFDLPYMHNLRDFLKQQKTLGKIVYPRGTEIFNALNTTPFSKVKVVILGQDPYHGPNQAHGLSFSVRKGIPKPPSLINIYKEIERDLRVTMPDHGDLTGWAEQGVLLLNAMLTVEMAMAGSHQGKGWEQFTDAVIKTLNHGKEHIVFMLWGAYAQKKGAFIDRKKHLVLQSAHPSPLSAHRGFLGNGHFSATNEYLEKTGQTAIKWDQL